MTDANPVTYDARNPQTSVSATAARAVTGRPKLAAVRSYARPDAAIDNRPATAAAWQVREEPEYYIPDLLSGRDYAPDPALIEAAEAHTQEQREAMALLDDAENLLAVLLASQEQECDSRAMQAEAVLNVVRKKLRQAHNRIDRQESSHRNAIFAWFELKERMEAGGESVTSRDDDENGTDTGDPPEAGAFDPDADIHDAIVARERAGGAYLDGDAVEAMEEPLRRLASAAMVFSDIPTESTAGSELRMRNLLADMMCRDAIRLFRLYHGHSPQFC